MTSIPSVHIIGSRDMGGAERWFVRFLHAMQQHGQYVQAIVRAGSTLAHQHLAGIPTQTTPMRTVWDPISRWQLARELSRTPAPIVQTYMGRATRLTHIPQHRGKIHLARLGGYYDIAPFRHAHAWIGNTRGLCDWMIQQGLPANRVYHITNFAATALPEQATEQAMLRARLNIASDDLLLLTAGRFVGVKGHPTLLEAFAGLPKTLAGKRPRLILLGDGDMRAELTTQATQLGILDRIIWAGWQQEPAPWFHLADLIVFPSRDAETLGNVILEAWAYGKPLIATAFRGARELARHEEDAYIVPCDNAPALTAGIEAVATQPVLQAHMVQQGLQRIANDFSETAVIGQYIQLYEHLLREG